MSVVAKLYVADIDRKAGSPDAVIVVLAAVTRGDDNKAWAEATPQATFTMTVQNPVAAAQFKLGQEFHVTFEPLEPVVDLSTPHDYEPNDYEKQHGDTYGNGRCVICQCKRVSHDEPLRSLIVKLAGLA